MTTRKEIEQYLFQAGFQMAQETRRGVAPGFEARDDVSGATFVNYYRGSDLYVTEDTQKEKIHLIEVWLMKKYDVIRKIHNGITFLRVKDRQYKDIGRLLRNCMANLPAITNESEAVYAATALRYIARRLAAEGVEDKKAIDFVDQTETWINLAAKDVVGE